MTVSMLNGENGRQAAELDELAGWLQNQFKPDLICLSNALLTGMARRLKHDLKAPVVCTFQGEDCFLDALTQPYRDQSWKTLQERSQDVDLFIAPSQFYAGFMGRRLGLKEGKIKVVHNGIELAGFETASSQNPPVLGFFARMCPEKGLDILVDAFLLLKQRNRIPGLRLKIGGSLGPGDEAFVESLKARLRRSGVLNQTDFCPNLDRGAKLAFYRSLSVFSAPVRYNEAFGLYIAEAMAAGVPVVQPRSSSFPELVALSGGGLLYEPGNLHAQAEAIEGLLLNREKAEALGQAGRKAAMTHFNVDTMARAMAAVYAEVICSP
jgi:glycosyltransferase involved in cell wall biosynthesis